MGENDDTTAPPADETKSGGDVAPVMIPKPRLDDALRKNRELQARLDALEAKKAPTVEPPEEPGEPEEQKRPTKATRPIGQDDGDSRFDNRVIRLRLDHSISQDAAEVVARYESQNGLSPADALAFAKQRRPDLFGKAETGPNPSTHTVSTPASGDDDEPPKEPEQSEFMKVRSISNFDLRDRAGRKRAVDLVKAKMFGGRGTK